MESVSVKKSRNGQGLFTQINLSPGDTILEVKGKFINCDEEEDLDERIRSNSFRFDEDKYLSPEGEQADFLNHSCDPNAKVSKIRNKLFIVAIKDIHRGEEVFIDYSTILAADDTWKMKCNCGARNCRGVIKKFKSLPASLRQEYIASKIVPDYILEINASV